MVDWADYERTATPWSLMVARGAEGETWLARAVARAGHMDEWCRAGGCGLCRRAAVYPMRPPFCAECWREHVVRVAAPQSAQRAGVLPVTLTLHPRAGVVGMHFDRRETGRLVLRGPLVRGDAGCDTPQTGDVDE